MRRITAYLGLFILLSISSATVKGQYYFYDNGYYDNDMIVELGGSLGAMNCLTDLGGNEGIGARFIKDMNYNNTNLAGGIFLGMLYKNKFGLRLEATSGVVSAYDSILKGITDIAKERFNRNLNFKSTIAEVSLMAEIHPLFIFINYDDRGLSAPRFSPYLLGGIGYFAFNPQAKLGNNWVDLQPLSTEGQGFAEYPDRQPYKLKQMNIPFGLGVKYELSPLINVRSEFVYRKLNTDYLDDCSSTYIDPAAFYNHLTGADLSNALLLNDRQIVSKMGPGSKRGGPDEKDAYFTFNLKVSILFGRSRIR